MSKASFAGDHNSRFLPSGSRSRNGIGRDGSRSHDGALSASGVIVVAGPAFYGQYRQGEGHGPGQKSIAEAEDLLGGTTVVSR